MDEHLLQEIADNWRRSQADAKLVYSRDELPVSYDCITREWLTSVLCGENPSAQVEHFQLGPRDDGNTNRRQISLTYNKVGEQACLPKAIFCKASHGLENRITINGLGMDMSEIIFYSRLRSQLNIEAPTGLFWGIDRNSFNYMVILNDLSEARFCTHLTRITKDLAMQMVSLLAMVHQKFSNRRQYLCDVGLKPWSAFCRTLVDMGWERGNEIGLAAAADVIPSRLRSASGKIWPCIVAAVQRHAALPSTLVHCDVHLRNWYMTPDDQMGLCDWQNVCLAHWSRDLAYMISCALTPDDRRNWETELIGFYLEEMRAGGVDVPNFDETFKLYRQQMFPALGFWTITYKPPETIPDAQPEEASVEFIRRMAIAIDDLDGLNSFD